jgi:hypothetical protein
LAIAPIVAQVQMMPLPRKFTSWKCRFSEQPAKDFDDETRSFQPLGIDAAE